MNSELPDGGSRRGGARGISLNQIDADYERKGRALGGQNPRKEAYYLGAGKIGPLGVAFALHRLLWLENHSMTAVAFGE